MLATTWTIAHQGGWDEFIMFAIPIVLAVIGVRWAERRGKARRAAESENHADQES